MNLHFKRLFSFVKCMLFFYHLHREIFVQSSRHSQTKPYIILTLRTMSSHDFKDQIKESNLLIKQKDGSEHILTCTIIEFLDKIIIQLAMDGETDISYDLQIPELDDIKKPIRKFSYDDSEFDGHWDSEEDNSAVSSTIIPTVLIGAGQNMKTQVLAAQVGYLMSQFSTHNIILNVSGKLFGRPNTECEYHPNDSIIVEQVLHIIKETYLHSQWRLCFVCILRSYCCT